PYHRSTPRAGVTVQPDGQNVKITAPGEETILSAGFYAFRDAQRTVVTSFDAAPANAFGVSISGGAAEVVLSASGVKITVHGAPGRRTINLGPLGTRTVDYAGGDPLTVQ
ncbi:MAG: hypothetical protein SFV54_10935, partial [Bryobacteraceae bacterium]|nr:hypothetical protein [Bryobacteraceae bacterium]